MHVHSALLDLTAGRMHVLVVQISLEGENTAMTPLRKSVLGLVTALALCFGVSAVGLVVTSQQSQPPPYVKTDRCPSEDSCEWVPVSAFRWDWVPVVP